MAAVWAALLDGAAAAAVAVAAAGAAAALRGWDGPEAAGAAVGLVVRVAEIGVPDDEWAPQAARVSDARTIAAAADARIRLGDEVIMQRSVSGVDQESTAK